ncbi:cystatin C (amyloid angiopathy and cerebral hemorrhage) [Electrophorus electricus]|uniref:Cystatin domain-containing protein n=1 Tax=Electrophorus electricus TaxID=8005 RepID=A0A4W4DSE4_ELEEL|nr:cystatin C (amyloid angiopathy and cerebral hemorrhage) [Electrophorus electricus]
MFLKVVAPILAFVLVVGSATFLPGGVSPADISSPSVKNALDFAVAQHNKASNDVYLSTVSKVISAKQQVVSGMKYYFTIDMVRTSCKKRRTEVCADKPGPTVEQPKQCELVVWSQPWTDTIKLLKNSCN